MGFVSIDNRPEFFMELLNSTYLNDTFMYNVTNISSTAAEERDEKGSTIEFVLMSLVTVLLGLLILITIIGKAHKTHIKHLCMLLSLSTYWFLASSLAFQEMFLLSLPFSSRNTCRTRATIWWRHWPWPTCWWRAWVRLEILFHDLR